MSKKHSEVITVTEKQAFEWLARVATVANDQSTDMSMAQGIDQMNDVLALANMVNNLAVASNAIEIMITNAKARAEAIAQMAKDLM